MHLVGHSFGGLVGLAVALRGRVPLASLSVLEAPAPGSLAVAGRDADYAAFREMTDAYAADFRGGNPAAIATVIDFYGGAGTFAAWPQGARDFAMATTPTNLLDWIGAYAFKPEVADLRGLTMPRLVVAGADSHPAVIAANRLIAEAVPKSRFELIPGSAHFMIVTHAAAVAFMVAEQVQSVPG